MNDPHAHHHHDGQTLNHDLPDLIRTAFAGRRRALRFLSAGSVGLVAGGALSACGGGSDGSSATNASTSTSTGTTSTTTTGSGTTTTTTTTTTATGTTTTGSSTSSCSVIPEETAGPYPADGSNGLTRNSGSVINVLTQSGVVRQDIRSSFGSASATAQGVPLTIRLKLVNTGASCASLEGFAVYLWHCDRDGNYSLYSSGLTSENYLRGVQVSDANGELSFTSIFPGCYAGRWPHIHFEVYRSLATATSASNDIKTSQLALPDTICRTVYESDSNYSASIRNFNSITLASDNVFGEDSGALQMATVTGNMTEGYVATLTVGVSA